MDNEKIKRINELAKKSRTPEGLTLEERIEQQSLRQEYIDSCKRNLEAQLKNICLKRNTEDSVK